MGTREEITDDNLALVPGEFTTTFGLHRHLRPPGMKFDFVPVLDLVVLALLLSLLFTRYLILPGIRVDLPETKLSIQQDASRVAVLTIANGGMLFFAGSVYEHNSIEQGFRQYFDSEDKKVEPPVLLVKAAASIDLQQFLDLCEMAQNAGFGEVQIAADPKKEANGLIPQTISGQNNNVVFPVQ